MNKVLDLLAKYIVTEYELVTWLTTALEYKACDDNCTERMNSLRKELNVLSWHV